MCDGNYGSIVSCEAVDEYSGLDNVVIQVFRYITYCAMLADSKSMPNLGVSPRHTRLRENCANIPGYFFK